MSVQYEKAKPEDYEDVIDFGNYVFSQAHVPHDFPVLLPKLYKREYFMDGLHYIAREDNRIKAIIGAYPVDMKVSGQSLPGGGIGLVSVHPYCRSRGFMKTLMNMALEDMKKDGMAFSCLGGQRQRYEYFGYTPAGSSYNFECTATNIRHTLGREFKTSLSVKQIGPGDTDLLDQIRRMHESKPAYILREKDRFFHILSSWESPVFAIMEGPEQRVTGYLLCRPNGKHIHEIYMEDNSRIAEAIGVFLQTRNGSGGDVTISAQPYEMEKIAALSRFAESYRQGPAYNFAVFDYPRFISPFLKLKSSYRTMADGKFVLQIEEGPRLALTVSGGQASVSETQESADLSLNRLDALRFLFSADAAAGSGVIAGNPFLQSLLPLPLFFETADEV
jgi:predicted acetyltransferase